MTRVRRFDVWVVLALTWLFTAIGVTLVFGPLLGFRGWCWLVTHHVLCVAGVSHELQRGWRRYQRRRREDPSHSGPGVAHPQRRFWY